jgi:acyl carrier protein
MKTDAAEIAPRVRGVFAQQFNGAENAPDDEPLPNALGGRYDSLAVLELITSIEQEFGIEVDFVAHDVRYWFSQIGLITQFVADQLDDKATANRDGDHTAWA